MRTLWLLVSSSAVVLLFGCHLFVDPPSSQGAGSNPLEIQVDGGIPLALRALPKDRSYAEDRVYVDWVRAVREGYIDPRGSINENSEKEEDKLFDLDIIFVTNDPFVSDVIFSHTVHAYWLSCKNCHPKIFIARKNGNDFTMKDIWNGNYCGRCHGTVAFPVRVGNGRNLLSNCLKCHNHKKDRKPAVNRISPPP